MAVNYYPAGGSAEIGFAATKAQWFDPRSAAWAPALAHGASYSASGGTDEDGHPQDMVLVLWR